MNDVKGVAIARATLGDYLGRVDKASRDMARMELTRNMWRIEFATEAARMRKAAGLSLDNVAKQIGISKPMLHDFENHRRWSDWVAVELVRILDTSRPRAG